MSRNRVSVLSETNSTKESSCSILELLKSLNPFQSYLRLGFVTIVWEIAPVNPGNGDSVWLNKPQNQAPWVRWGYLYSQETFSIWWENLSSMLSHSCATLARAIITKRNGFWGFIQQPTVNLICKVRACCFHLIWDLKFAEARRILC